MLSDLCGTDAITGTTDVRLIKGLNAVGLWFVEHAPGNIENLIAGLKRKSKFIVRCLFGGMKHWIVVSDYRDNGDFGCFTVYDPAQGIYEMSKGQLSEVWAPREWQAFEIPPVQDSAKFLRVDTLENEEGYAQAIELAKDAFQGVVSREAVPGQLKSSLPNMSIGVWVGDKVIGAYFLSLGKLFWQSNLSAICGLGLVVDPAYRGRGYGTMLRAIPSRIGADYVWGMQHKSLDNLNDWLKRRVLIKDSPANWVTVEPITDEAKKLVQFVIDNPEPEPPPLPLYYYGNSNSVRWDEWEDDDCYHDHKYDFDNEGEVSIVSALKTLCEIAPFGDYSVVVMEKVTQHIELLERIIEIGGEEAVDEMMHDYLSPYYEADSEVEDANFIEGIDNENE
jgi:GNAT superfamily N-acetyltransferase